MAVAGPEDGPRLDVQRYHQRVPRSLEAHSSGWPHAVAHSAEYWHSSANATVPGLPGQERTQHEVGRHEAGACVRADWLPGRQKAG